MDKVFLHSEARFLFTVIVPTRNRCSMLRAAIKSLLWQTCQDFECIVLDDASADGTPSVFQEFSGLANFQWHRFSQNKGYPHCRNFAIRRSNGRFITFLDDDDIWLPDRLQEFKMAAESRPETGFWFSNAYLWRYERIVGTVFGPHKPIPEGRVPGYYAVGEKYLPYLTTNMSIAREAFSKVGLLREELSILADTEMAARILSSGIPVGVIRKPLAVRRIHEKQITRDYERDFRESMIALKSGGATPEVEKTYREELILQTAEYLIKSLKPRKAMQFLLNSSLRRGWWFYRLLLLALLPAPLLGWLRQMRTAYLKLRCHPWLATNEYRRATRLLRSIQEKHKTPHPAEVALF